MPSVPELMLFFYRVVQWKTRLSRSQFHNKPLIQFTTSFLTSASELFHLFSSLLMHLISIFKLTIIQDSHYFFDVSYYSCCRRSLSFAFGVHKKHIISFFKTYICVLVLLDASCSCVQCATVASALVDLSYFEQIIAYCNKLRKIIPFNAVFLSTFVCASVALLLI